MDKRFLIFTYILDLALCYPLSAQTWVGLGAGADKSVRSLYADTVNKLLYAGGNFKYMDSIEVNGIAIWNGTSWYPLGYGDTSCNNFCFPVFSIVDYKGYLYAAGMFTYIGGIQANGIARWNGNNWSDVNGGADASVNGLYIYNDELYVMGWFYNIGGISANKIAKWNGTGWSNLDNTYFGSGNIWTAIEYLGNLYVGGNFNGQNGMDEIAMWDGASWTSVGGGIKGDSWVGALEVYKGELYVGGYFFSAAGNAGSFIMKWNGSNWSDVGGGVLGVNGYSGQVFDLTVFNDELYAVGQFSTAGGINASRIAKWNGFEWCSLASPGTSVQQPSAITVYDNTIVIGGGVIQNSDTLRNIAKWTGGNYTDTCGVLVSTKEPLPSTNTEFNISPNPTTGKITLTNPPQNPQGSISVYNVLGEQVLSSKPFKGQIDLSICPPGVYFLQIKQGERIRKVVKL